MLIADLGAGDIGVKGLDPMNQPVVRQKREGAVDGNRCQSTVRAAHASEDFVRAKGHVVRCHDIQNPATLRRQPKVALGAEAVYTSHHVLDTAVMVMVGRWKCNGVYLHSSSSPIAKARRFHARQVLCYNIRMR